MKNRKRVLVISTFFLLIIVGIVCLIRFTQKKCIYTLVNIRVNGKSIDISNLKNKCFYEDVEEYTYIFDENSFQISDVKYGKYDMMITIPKEQLDGFSNDLCVKLEYVNLKDNISVDNKCILNINSRDDTISGKYSVDHVVNKEKYYYSGDIKIKNNILEVYWGG